MQKPKGYMDAIRAGVILTLYTCKLSLDLVSSINFCSTDEDPWWCGISVSFTAVPSVLVNAYLLYQLHDKRALQEVYKKVLLCVAACLQLLPFIWLVWALVQLCGSNRKNIDEIKKTMLAIIIIQSILECVPQLCLQSYIVMELYQNTFYPSTTTTEMINVTTPLFETTQTTVLSTIASVSTISSTIFSTTDLSTDIDIKTSQASTIQTTTEQLPTDNILDDWRIIILLVNLAVGLILVTFAVGSGITYTSRDEDEDEDEDEEEEGNIELIMKILVYLFPFIGVGTRVFICGVLGTYNPGFWFIPICSALLLSAVCNYIIKKDKTWDERLLDSLFNTTGNFLTKSSIPASFAYFVPATVFFAIYIDNPLCIAAFSLGLICFLINIIVASLQHFLQHST